VLDRTIIGIKNEGIYLYWKESKKILDMTYPAFQGRGKDINTKNWASALKFN
jgi:hypothetical protein